MHNSLVSYDCKDRIAQIRLERPDKLNAMNLQLVSELLEAVYHFDTDDTAWVGIISGAGRSFCAGADINERVGTPHGRGVTSAPFSDVLLQRFQHYKPVISAVHGHACGAGFTLALDSDLIIADETAQFQITEVVRGIDGTQLWARLGLRVRGSFADDLASKGRACSASEASEVGLGNPLVPADNHLQGALALVESLL